MQIGPSKVGWVVGCTWRIVRSSLRPELVSGMRDQDREFERRLLNVFNHGFHKTQHGHVSNYAHVFAQSFCAPTYLFSVCCVQKQVQLLRFRRQPFRVHLGAKTCLHVGTSTQTYALSQRTAPAVLNRMTHLCTELQWFTGVSSALPCPAPFLRTVYSCRASKLCRFVATNATIDDDLAIK